MLSREADLLPGSWFPRGRNWRLPTGTTPLLENHFYWSRSIPKSAQIDARGREKDSTSWYEASIYCRVVMVGAYLPNSLPRESSDFNIIRRKHSVCV